ncbi:STAS domain-containing protein [Streptomyces sp. NPDC054854]
MPMARPDLVFVTGELDLDSGRAAAADAALQRAVTDPASPPEITADVSGLAFCDCTGLNILLRAQLAALSHGRTLRLQGANPQLVRSSTAPERSPSSPSTRHPRQPPDPKPWAHAGERCRQRGWGGVGAARGTADRAGAGPLAHPWQPLRRLRGASGTAVPTPGSGPPHMTGAGVRRRNRSCPPRDEADTTPPGEGAPRGARMPGAARGPRGAQPCPSNEPGRRPVRATCASHQDPKGVRTPPTPAAGGQVPPPPGAVRTKSACASPSWPDRPGGREQQAPVPGRQRPPRRTYPIHVRPATPPAASGRGNLRRHRLRPAPLPGAACCR